MALPALQWRMLPPVVVTSTAQPSFILDAIYTAGTSAVYADGSARVLGNYAIPGNAGQVPTLPASGFAWTWNYDATTKSTFAGEKTACYAVPASGALNQQVIFMGINSAAVVGATWKQFIDTRAVQYLYGGLAKNSGVYTAFDNALTPFTVGDFTGFAMCANTAPVAGITLLYMWESAEAVIVQFRNSATNGQTVGAIAGAFIDPLSVNLANAETDGRLYGISATGVVIMPGTWLGTGASGCFLFHSNSVTDPHFGTFTPGLGTIALAARGQTFTPTSGFSSRNGDLPEIPYQINALTGGGYFGQLRQMFVTRDSLTGIAWEALGVQKGYLLGASTVAATDAMLLTY